MGSLHPLQQPLSSWLPRLLDGPFQTFQNELKTSTLRAGGARREVGRGLCVWKGGGVGMESKSGEVCSPLVCNFQNDSRTGAKVRESKALSTSASCGREAWSPQDACPYKSTVSRACWRWGQWAHMGVGTRTMGPGQCAGPEQMCPGTTGAPICETNWPTIEKLVQLQQSGKEKQTPTRASPRLTLAQPCGCEARAFRGLHSVREMS